MKRDLRRDVVIEGHATRRERDSASSDLSPVVGGMFHALMQSDPSKKGSVGLLTDLRGTRGESMGVELFIQGAIEDVGRIVASVEEASDVLRAWR